MQGLSYAVAILASLGAINAYKLGFSDKIACLHKADQLQSRVFEEEIKLAIEEFREQLKTVGVPEIGLPPIDPLDIDEERIQLNNDAVNLDLNLTTLAHGLASFGVVHVKMSLIGLKFEIDLQFPVITATGKYGLLANTPLAAFEVFGNGDFDVKATNFLIQAKGKVGTKIVEDESKIILEQLEVDLTLEDMDFKITGFLGNEALSKVISGAISEGLPKVLKDIKDEINDVLKEIIHVINDFLINSRSMNFPEINYFNTMC